MTQTYEVYALKYGERVGRRSQNFVGGDRHDGPMPMDYFVWAVVGGGRTWVIDTGFTRADGEGRGRTYLRSVTDALAAIDVDAATVTDVVLTHLHYDHLGGFGEFPAARFHLQDAEMAYATGRYMAHHALQHGFTPEQVAALVLEVYKGRVVFHDGDDELAPGLSLHLVAGHTLGMQSVRVQTRVGNIVVASDAAHYYENITSGRPFIAVHDIGRMLDGHRRLARLADDERFVVPGHDPLVLERYPAARDDLAGIVARLDAEPAA
jgi:glyoxylase-like metal-dependent hydrolase (beta-lactamase superfamily II)